MDIDSIIQELIKKKKVRAAWESLLKFLEKSNRHFYENLF